MLGASSADSFANLIPMMIAVSTFSTAIITLIGFSISKRAALVGERSEKSINEIHVIVNSQRTEMLKEIDGLKIKSNILGQSNTELRDMFLSMSKMLLESKKIGGAQTAKAITIEDGAKLLAKDALAAKIVLEEAAAAKIVLEEAAVAKSIIVKAAAKAVVSEAEAAKIIIEEAAAAKALIVEAAAKALKGFKSVEPDIKLP